MSTLTVTVDTASATIIADSAGVTVTWSDALVEPKARQTFINRLSGLACTLQDAETFRGYCQDCLAPEGPDALVEGSL